MASIDFFSVAGTAVGLVEFSGFSGVLSISGADGPTVTRIGGLADRVNAVTNSAETRFAIASGTKIFTSLGILRLVEEGHLSLDQSVRSLFPDKLSQMDPAVTVAHLLTHTSGFYDYYDEEANPDPDNFFLDIPWYRLETPSDYLPLMVNSPMVAAVGEPFRYNNGGFVLLGAIIEAVSGELYRDFLEREVLVRAGMSRSGFFAFNSLPAQTAAGYVELPGGEWKSNIYNVPIRGGGDGGMYTTAEDLDRFWRALSEGSIVSDQMVRDMTTPQVEVDEGTAYGYGVWLGIRGPVPTWFVVGGDAGVGFDSRFFPSEGVVISILANTTGGEEHVRSAVYDGLERQLSDRD